MKVSKIYTETYTWKKIGSSFNLTTNVLKFDCWTSFILLLWISSRTQIVYDNHRSQASSSSARLSAGLLEVWLGSERSSGRWYGEPLPRIISFSQRDRDTRCDCSEHVLLQPSFVKNFSSCNQDFHCCKKWWLSVEGATPQNIQWRQRKVHFVLQTIGGNCTFLCLVNDKMMIFAFNWKSSVPAIFISAICQRIVWKFSAQCNGWCYSEANVTNPLFWD